MQMRECAHVCAHFMFRCKMHMKEDKIASSKRQEEGKWKHWGKDNGPKSFQVLGFLNILYI